MSAFRFCIVILTILSHCTAKSLIPSVERQRAASWKPLERRLADEKPQIYPYIPPEKQYTSEPSTSPPEESISSSEPPILYPYIPPEQQYTSGPSVSPPEELIGGSPPEELIGESPPKDIGPTSGGYKAKGNDISSFIGICFGIATLFLW